MPIAQSFQRRMLSRHQGKASKSTPRWHKMSLSKVTTGCLLSFFYERKASWVRLSTDSICCEKQIKQVLISVF